MTTMSTIVDDALEILGVSQVGESSSNEDAAFALGVLNDMLHGWRAKGVDIGHKTLALTDTVNLLSEHDEGVKVLLATHPRMVARFGVRPDGDLVLEAHRAWGAIYAAHSSPAPARLVDGLKRMPNSPGREDRNL